MTTRVPRPTCVTQATSGRVACSKQVTPSGGCRDGTQTPTRPARWRRAAVSTAPCRWGAARARSSVGGRATGSAAARWRGAARTRAPDRRRAAWRSDPRVRAGAHARPAARSAADEDRSALPSKGGVAAMKNRSLILASLLLATFLINVDTTIVNVALPTLVRQLHASNSHLQWIVDAFNLLFAAAVLAAGSLSDRFGRKGMLLAGLTVFGL